MELTKAKTAKDREEVDAVRALQDDGRIWVAPCGAAWWIWWCRPCARAPRPTEEVAEEEAKQLATLLHQMGLNHERLSVRSQGLDVRLTGVNPAKVIKPILA